MKKLLILSGKGGTGKTTIASAFIDLAAAEAFADCDVDAPNLHLVMQHPSQPRVSDFYGMDKAMIDTSKCQGCEKCLQNCRFDAIIPGDAGLTVDNYACEGCGLCKELCPARAIHMEPFVAGELRMFQDKSIFSTARLKMGSGNSGKLVTEVKKQLQREAQNKNLAIIDGSPGIGCPVIASLSGVDLVLIVAEPSLSGISDLERILKTAVRFNTKTSVCVNKWDINPKNTERIETMCRENGIPYAGRIPFDAEAIKAINRGENITDTPCKAGTAVKKVFIKTITLLEEEK
jgi:MinD superfamily P-loop ATPase